MDEVKIQYAHARALFEAGKHVEALNLLKEIEAQAPENKKIKLAIAMAHAKLGAYEQARLICEALVHEHNYKAAQELLGHIVEEEHAASKRESVDINAPAASVKEFATPPKKDGAMEAQDRGLKGEKPTPSAARVPERHEKDEDAPSPKPSDELVVMRDAENAIDSKLKSSDADSFDLLGDDDDLPSPDVSDGDSYEPWQSAEVPAGAKPLEEIPVAQGAGDVADASSKPSGVDSFDLLGDDDDFPSPDASDGDSYEPWQSAEVPAGAKPLDEIPVAQGAGDVADSRSKPSGADSFDLWGDDDDLPSPDASDADSYDPWQVDEALPNPESSDGPAVGAGKDVVADSNIKSPEVDSFASWTPNRAASTPEPPDVEPPVPWKDSEGVSSPEYPSEDSFVPWEDDDDIPTPRSASGKSRASRPKNVKSPSPMPAAEALAAKPRNKVLKQKPKARPGARRVVIACGIVFIAATAGLLGLAAFLYLPQTTSLDDQSHSADDAVDMATQGTTSETVPVPAPSQPTTGSDEPGVEDSPLQTEAPTPPATPAVDVWATYEPIPAAPDVSRMPPWSGVLFGSDQDSVLNRYHAARLAGNSDGPDLNSVKTSFLVEAGKNLESASRYALLETEEKAVASLRNALDGKGYVSNTEKATTLVWRIYREADSRSSTRHLSRETLIENEISHVRALYMSHLCDPLLRRIKDAGLENTHAQRVQALKTEIMEYERLSIDDIHACQVFLEKYPHSTNARIVQTAVYHYFKYAYDQNRSADLVSALIKYVPYYGAQEFYTSEWNGLCKELEGKSPREQLRLLAPWTDALTYKLGAPTEIRFLGAVLTLAGRNQAVLGKDSAAALSFLTVRALFNNRQISLRFDIMLSRMESLSSSRDINQWMQNIDTCNSNMNDVTSLLMTAARSVGTEQMTLAAFRYLLNNIDMEDQDDEPLDFTENIGFSAASASPSETACLNMCETLVRGGGLIGAPLDVLSVFGYPRATESILKAPNLFTYEDYLSFCLRAYPKETEQVAVRLLRDDESDAFDKARALYGLGILQITTEHAERDMAEELGELSFYQDFYRVRNEIGYVYTHLANLAKAAEEHKDALALYGLVIEDRTPPKALLDNLDALIRNSKEVTEAELSLYEPLIRNLSTSEKTALIDRMFNAEYLVVVRQAMKLYPSVIPENVSTSMINNVMRGGNPYKKSVFCATLAERDPESAQKMCRAYLNGEYHTAADDTFFEELLKREMTKSYSAGTNLNWSAVNAAVTRQKNATKIAMMGADSILNAAGKEAALKFVVESMLSQERFAISGLAWLLTNYEPGELDITKYNIQATSATQKAVYAFCKSYYAQSSEYDAFIREVKAIEDVDDWYRLSRLAFVASEAPLSAPATPMSSGYCTAVSDPLLSGLAAMARDTLRIIATR